MLRFALLSLLIGHSSSSFADPSPKGEYLRKGYYIVVAAYRIGHEKYMETYVDKLNKSGLHTKHGYDLGRKFYYIYLDYYTDFDESIHQMLKTRKEGGFTDAWVRVMPDMAPENSIIATTPVVEKMAEEKTTVEVQVASLTRTVPIDKEPEVIALPIVESTPGALPETTAIMSNKETVKAEPVRVLRTLANTPVYLSLVHSRNNRIVESEIEIIDTERTRVISKVKGNSYVMLPDPKSKSGQLTLNCNAFGYRKVQHEVNFKNNEMDTPYHYMVLMDSFYVVKFDLIRYHKGDISTLYSVYFYNDAAIMLPESTFELNSLLDMMNDNPKYKIKLHGHTNGKSHGKMITMGPGKNFFALTDDVKNGIGSAKDLSRERAQVIKDWLVSQGVAADRMEIKAWGGGRMIHEKESANAKKNVRVEVEVIEE